MIKTQGYSLAISFDFAPILSSLFFNENEINRPSTLFQCDWDAFKIILKSFKTKINFWQKIDKNTRL